MRKFSKTFNIQLGAWTLCCCICRSIHVIHFIATSSHPILPTSQNSGLRIGQDGTYLLFFHSPAFTIFVMLLFILDCFVNDGFMWWLRTCQFPKFQGRSFNLTQKFDVGSNSYMCLFCMVTTVIIMQYKFFECYHAKQRTQIPDYTFPLPCVKVLPMYYCQIMTDYYHCLHRSTW